MHVFQKIKASKGTNEKLKIAITEFTKKHHRFMEVCFNDEVYGISGAGIGKAIQYDAKLHGKCEDYGEFIEKLTPEEFESRFTGTSYNYQIEDFVSSLLKHSGNKQIDELRMMLGSLDQYEMPWFLRAIQKNMRIGFNLTSYNKIREAHGLTPIIPRGVQLCGKIKLDEVTTLKYPRYAEYKYDGERCEIDCKKDGDDVTITLTSRGNSDITERYPEVVKFFEEAFKLSTHKHVKYDCEIISKDFIKLSTRMHRNAENIKEFDTDLRAVIFDIMLIDGQNIAELTQLERRQLVDTHALLLGFDTSYQEMVHSHEELTEFYNKARSIGQEGVVTKDLDMKWTQHSRDGWIKLVPQCNLDLRIVKGYYGTGKYANQINGVELENRDGTIKTKAASGIKDFERQLLTELHNKGELIGKIAEIKYREIQPPKDGVSALRFPVFIRLRDDKFESD